MDRVLMPVDEMRRIDAEIAEKVFGLDPLNARHGLHENGDLEYYWGYPVGHDVAPRYSTDIAAAWQIIEHLQKQGWGFELMDRGAQVSCIFNTNPDDLYYSTDDTASLAICKAALKAVE